LPSRDASGTPTRPSNATGRVTTIPNWVGLSNEDPLGTDLGKANPYCYGENSPLVYRYPLGTVAALEYVSMVACEIKAPCNLAIAVQTLYLQIFAALRSADLGAFDPKSLDALIEASAGLGGFSVQDSLNNLAPAISQARDEILDKLNLTSPIPGLLSVAQTHYECASGLNRGP
jgi:hypothetical protein